jgi:hypothetical protein
LPTGLKYVLEERFIKINSVILLFEGTVIKEALTHMGLGK